MAKLALVVRLEAKAGKAGAVARFLSNDPGLVRPALGPVTQFALRLGPSSFTLFNVFANETNRQAYLNGEFIARLKAMADTHFAQPPVVENADVLEGGVAEGRERPPTIVLRLRPRTRPRNPKASWLRFYL